MQRDRFVVARTWLDNARADLAVAAEIAGRFPSRACFHAQQAAELALKAALIAVADDHPRRRVADALVGELADLDIDVPAAVAEAANRLDLFYMASRNPDVLAGADPLKVFHADDAETAGARARIVCDFAANVLESVANVVAADDSRSLHVFGCMKGSMKLAGDIAAPFGIEWKLLRD